MKKFKVLSIIMLLVLVLNGCKGEQSIKKQQLVEKDILVVNDLNGIDESNINKYTIEVDLNTDEMIYKGKQIVSYVNNTDIDLEEVYFHLYPNAFKSIYSAPMLFDIGETIDASSYIPGYIDIEKVQTKGESLEWNILEDIDTILHIKLDEPLKKGKTTELYLEYTVKLPTTKDRFGYHDKGINFGNWYPIACVYDEKGWNLEPYYHIGDPFYSETSNYNVSITTPKEMKIATSGKIVSETENGDKKTYKIEGKLIRDFAWVASKDFKIKERVVDDTIIKVYSIKNNSSIIDKSLDIGEKAIKTFNRVFGKYPYGQYSIVITRFPSGMEYPGIIFISDEYPSGGPLEIVIVHETAHQWWYGVVGNDQVNEAWLDEGLTTYSEAIYTKEVYGEERAKLYYENNFERGYEYAKEYLGKDHIVNKPLGEFEGWNDYSPLVYTRAAMFIHKIKEDFGEELLYKILNEYFEKYKFHIATTDDFIKICEDMTQTSFDSLTKAFLYGDK